MRTNTQIKKKCPTCKHFFWVIFSRRNTAKFCSKQCIRASSAKKKLLSNQRKGIPKSKEWKQKASLAKRGDKNPMWKGDKAKLEAIHIWVLARKPKPKFCEECDTRPPKDLANISQKYKRDVKDFEWLCRRCHMIKDGRINNLKKGV